LSRGRGLAIMSALMECRCLPFTVVPRTTRLYADYLYDFPRVQKFYAYPPFEESSLQAAAKTIPRHVAMRSEVAAILREHNERFGGGPAVIEAVNRLAAGSVMAVVTGQQVGLFSGPAYTIYKAVTAIRLARELTARGMETVPVFWIADEDHDVAEVNHTYFLDEVFELIRLEHGSPARHLRVGDIAFDSGIGKLTEQAAKIAGGEVARWLKECYREGETFGSAFGKLMARLFSDFGVVLLDAMDARLHRLGLAVFRRTVEESSELNRALLARGQELEKAGYHAQVKVREQTSLLFAMVNGRRVPLRRKNGNFVLEDGLRLSPREVLDWMERATGDFSPNVLLRPILQDTLLPTVAYIGGPAEAAYFAQANTLYERLLKRMPVFFPRASFTLVEPRTERLLAKYGLSVEDAFRGPQRLERAIASARLPRGLKSSLARAEKKIGEALDTLGGGLEKLDPTLVGAVSTGRKKVLYQLEKLRHKAARAEASRAEIARRHARMLQCALYPHHALQERVINFLPFLGRYGKTLLEQLIEQVTLRGGDHQVIRL